MDVNPVLNELTKVSTGVRWLFYGDSIASGVYHTFGMRDWAEHFRERIVWELRRSQDLVLNSAYSGFRVGNLLNDFAFRAEPFKPHAAFIMDGTNDSAAGLDGVNAYMDGLRALADRFKAIGCYVVYCTPPPMYGVNRPLPQYVEAMKKVAAEKETGLLDIFSLWMNHPGRLYLTSDGLGHATPEGYLKIAHDLFRYMGIFDKDNSTVCRLDCGLGL